MHVGAVIFATDYAIRTDELAAALEARGFESLFLPEHTHIPASRKSRWSGGPELPRHYWHTHDPFIALAFAAAATSTLKLATGICLVAQRDTFSTAKSVASLDLLSGGRFIFGIGGGWNVEEMADHGVEYDTRFKLLRERVLAMKALWTEEEAAFHGEFIDFEPAWMHPKPVQKPHPPILLGGESDYTLRRVVAYCDGWLPRAPMAFDPLDARQRLTAAAEAAGRDPSTLSITVYAAPPDAATLAGYAEAGIDRALLLLPPEGRDGVLRALDKHADLVRRG